MTQSRQELIEALQALDALANKWKYNKHLTYFTDSGVNARSKYPCQMALMQAGKKHKIRALIGANGSGKSVYNALETYFHVSGRYPHWWTGYKFTYPIDAWVCARESKALREGIQEIVFGGIGPDQIGTGIIPKDDLLNDKGEIQTWVLPGVANCIGQCLVRHYTNEQFDGYSKIEFKTYAQGWQEFQGPTRQWISFDEEPDDEKIFAECIARLRPKDGKDMGLFLATFTPTNGFTNTYLAFVPQGKFPESGIHPEDPSKFTQVITWNNSPHLTEEWKASAIAQWKLTDPNNIEARTQGIAAQGSGRVYPIDESFVIVPKFRIPTYWPKWYGLDPGAAHTGVIWFTKDPSTNVTYIFDEYKNGRVIYLLHAEAIKLRGEWIRGGIDPHEAVKPRDTGETIQSYFETQGLHLTAAKGDPDALRAMIRAQFESGALKIMDTCYQLITEIRMFRFDMNDPNKIARNQEDHLCDAMMYGKAVENLTALSYAEIEEEQIRFRQKRDDSGDNERSSITGY